MVRSAALLLLASVILGCSGVAEDGSGLGCDSDAAPSRFASCVASWRAGPGAGAGQDRFPDVLYGPPHGAGAGAGSTDVLSLGRGGEIVVGFGGGAIVDGPGADFVVFENAFSVNGDAEHVFAEPGEVSVSEDGERWTAFPCQKEGYPYTGCAGWHPVLSSPDNGVSPFDPATAGGDPFDLADVGMTSARYLRVRDVSEYGGAPSAGFDFDAVAVVHP